MTCPRSQLICVCGSRKTMFGPLYHLLGKAERKGMQSWWGDRYWSSILKEPILKLPWLLFVFSYSFHLRFQKLKEAGRFLF